MEGHLHIDLYLGDVYQNKMPLENLAHAEFCVQCVEDLQTDLLF
jgi:hypothetical protein